MKNVILFAAVLCMTALLGCQDSPPDSVDEPGSQLVIVGSDQARIVNPADGSLLLQLTPAQEIHGLAWRPDGERLALADCRHNQIVELEAPAWNQVAVPHEGASCPWDLVYSPDGLSLATILPFRHDPLGGLFGKLSVSGPMPIDLELGRPLRALAWRPGGSELAVSTPGGLLILAAAGDYSVSHELSELHANALAYTCEGSRLIVGHGSGFTVLDATAGYAILDTSESDPVIDVAIDPRGIHVVLLTPTGAGLRRAVDLSEVYTLNANDGFRDADFSAAGDLLAIAESDGQVRLFEVADWSERPALAATTESVHAIAFRPGGQPRQPVLFVHGHSGDAVEAFHDEGAGTSFVKVLLANPGLPIDAFFLQLPVHGDGQNENRGIIEDAEDILAWIEGGPDSFGHDQVGILNLPAYADLGKLAIVAYSQGALSSRYYIKNLMGTVLGPANVVTVSELVTLAAPNHGLGGLLTCGDEDEPDRAIRQLCAGLDASLITQALPCGGCGPLAGPSPFNTNDSGDDSFLTDLNGHPLTDSCAGDDTFLSETPRSRPHETGGVLYANLYAANNEDLLVGGDEQSLDCAGRRLARLLSPDAVNREIDVDGGFSTHSLFPHNWEVICTALRTVLDGTVPAPGDYDDGLNEP